MAKQPTPHPRWDGPDFRPTQCTTCRHYITGGTCSAYPQGIPYPIMADFVSHKRPQPGDHGIQWEPKPAETTDGPVEYVLIHETTPQGWDVVGAVWYGEDGACSFLPAPRYEGTERSLDWLERIRASWRIGQSARYVFDGWSTFDNGTTIKAGRVEKADNLDVLRRRLARRP